MSLMELLLGNVRQAAASIGSYGNEMTSEEMISSGQEQRTAATSVCVLNEIIYGASGAWNAKLFREFGDFMLSKNLQNLGRSEGFSSALSVQAKWQTADKDDVKTILSDCASSILHDYLSAEVWDQPTDLVSSSFANKAALDDLPPPLHTFQDNVMLQKVQFLSKIRCEMKVIL